MRTYFKIQLEFDIDKLEGIIREKAKNGKGYCCFVDLNSLVYSHKHREFREILNNAVVNSCDGSYIATAASWIHGENLKQYIGPDLFKKFIFNDGIHVILGSTSEVYHKTIDRIKKENGDYSKVKFIDLPFKEVGEFDYNDISERISRLNANYIWVSLGAPKQEYFMMKLLPFLDNGMMIGVGAALNYFSGEIKDIPDWTKKLNIIWIYRLITEPKKQFKRLQSIVLHFPKIISDEKKFLKSLKSRVN